MSRAPAGGRTQEQADRQQLERDFKRLTVNEAFKVWNAATATEQKQLKPLLVKKAANAWKTLPPEQQPVVLQQLRGAIGTPKHRISAP